MKTTFQIPESVLLEENVVNQEVMITLPKGYRFDDCTVERNQLRVTIKQEEDQERSKIKKVTVNCPHRI